MPLSTRLRRPEPAPSLHWDGHALVGSAAGLTAVATLPARLVSFRFEDLPPAASEALKAAARLRAERAFAPLGPVAIDALFPAPRDGRVRALLLALPRTTITAVLAAAKAKGVTLSALRVAELLVPLPASGLVEVHGEGTLLHHSSGQLRDLVALGPVTDPAYAGRLARERMRLGLLTDAAPVTAAVAAPAIAPATATPTPSASPLSGSIASLGRSRALRMPAAEPVPGARIDFLHPTLHDAAPWYEGQAARRGLWAAGAAAAILLILGVVAWSAAAARDAAMAEAERLRPVAKALAIQRSEMKELAPWFDERASLTPGLHALAGALPMGTGELVRLVRVRQIPGDDSVAEGWAGDRSAMLGFLTRLRQDPRVKTVSLRTFRSPTKGSAEVVFELAFRLDPAVPTPPPGSATTAMTIEAEPQRRRDAEVRGEVESAATPQLGSHRRFSPSRTSAPLRLCGSILCGSLRLGADHADA